MKNTDKKMIAIKYNEFYRVTNDNTDRISDCETLKCPCGTLLFHFDGVEELESCNYCPDCENYLYDDNGNIMGKLDKGIGR